MINFKTLGVISALMILPACASTGVVPLEYNEASSARLRLASASTLKGTFMDGGAVIAVRKYDDESCSSEKTIARLRKGPFGGARTQSLGIPLSDFHKNASTEMFAAADQDTTFMFSLSYTEGTTTYSCASVFTIKFEEGKDYELSVPTFGPDYDSCYVNFYEIVTVDGESERNLISKFDNSADNTSPECYRAFTKVRWL